MNLYLIGYRGSGKSTVALLLGEQLQRPVADTDLLIEESAQQSIADIFAEEGESGFRQRETNVIRTFDRESDLIVSLGGGALLAETNRQWIAESGKTVWLCAPANVLWQRIAGDENSETRRPDLTDLGGLEEVKTVLEHRTPVYADCADYTLDVSSLSPEQIADNIGCWWQTVDRE